MPLDDWVFDEIFNSEPCIAMGDRGSRHPRCVICNGKFPFASGYAWGLTPDRKGFPHVFICWECVHWLSKVFQDHIVNFSYGYVFRDRRIRLGEYSSRVFRNEKVLP